MSDFDQNNLISFKLNNNNYTFYNYIIKKIGLLDSLVQDVGTDNIDLSWDISLENANLVFHCVFNISYSESCKNISTKSCFEIISFMKYIGMDDDFMRQVVKNLLKNVYIVQYIYEYSQMSPICEFAVDTFSNYFFWDTNCYSLHDIDVLFEISKILKIVQVLFSHLSIDLKISIIKNVISILSKNLISNFNALINHDFVIVDCQQDYDLYRMDCDEYDGLYFSYGYYGCTDPYSLLSVSFRDYNSDIIIESVTVNSTKIYNIDTHKKMDLVEIIIDHIAKLLLNIVEL